MAKGVRIIVRGVRRAEPDVEKLARALVQYALAAEKKRADKEQPDSQPGNTAKADP